MALFEAFPNSVRNRSVAIATEGGGQIALAAEDEAKGRGFSAETRSGHAA